MSNHIHNAKSIEKVLRSISLFIGMSVLLLLLIELVSWIIVATFQTYLPNTDGRAYADGYKTKGWQSEYFDEFNSIDSRWEPYVYWRRQAFDGRHINLSAQGYRRTTPSTLSEVGNPRLNIHVYGGSTIWGTGARDDYTIPSILQKMLDSAGIVTEVKNFGESGYVSTQEVLLLMRNIQKGDVPDLAIFYDGINDVYSAYQNKEAGLPQNEYNREAEFNLTNTRRRDELKALGIKAFLSDLNVMQLLRPIQGLLFTSRSTEANKTDINELTTSIVKRYSTNISIVLALSETFGFETLFFWQPVIFEKEARSEYEDRIYYSEETYREFFDSAYEALRLEKKSLPTENFRDLSLLFSQSYSEPVFIDAWHLTENGNKIIVDAILPQVYDKLGELEAR